MESNQTAKTKQLQTRTTKPEAVEKETIRIKLPNIQKMVLIMVGTSHLCINRFTAKAKEQIQATQQAGQVARSKTSRPKRDLKADYEGSRHKSEEGWDGFACAALRNAAISACRLVGYKMTIAKLSIFVEADGVDREDGTPLVRITSGKPREWTTTVRNKNGGADLRCRPRWDPGWEARPTIRYDADQFSETDIINLLNRAGGQVGIGEGRPDSKDGPGIGFGLFTANDIMRIMPRKI